MISNVAISGVEQFLQDTVFPLLNAIYRDQFMVKQFVRRYAEITLGTGQVNKGISSDPIVFLIRTNFRYEDLCSVLEKAGDRVQLHLILGDEMVENSYDAEGVPSDSPRVHKKSKKTKSTLVTKSNVKAETKTEIKDEVSYDPIYTQ